MARKNRELDAAMSAFRENPRKKTRKPKSNVDIYGSERDEYFRSFFTAEEPVDVHDGGPPEGFRWSIWDQSEPLERGPEPHPPWLVTDLAAVDHDLGALKSGKEADVRLYERAVPDTDRSCLMASKRYRSAKNSHFNRSEDYVSGRGIKNSREARALAKKTAFGKNIAAGRWSMAEFDALRNFWLAGVSVPYPIQVHGTEVLMQFVGSNEGEAAPRLAQLRPTERELNELWDQLTGDLVRLVRLGYTHGDLSAYNTCAWGGRLYMFDLPQIVDLYLNPKGFEFLSRDVANIGRWFVDHGLSPAKVDGLQALLVVEAGIG